MGKRERSKRANEGRRQIITVATIAAALAIVNNALGIFDRLWPRRPPARVVPATGTAVGTTRVVGVGAALRGQAFITLSATGTLTTGS